MENGILVQNAIVEVWILELLLLECINLRCIFLFWGTFFALHFVLLLCFSSAGFHAVHKWIQGEGGGSINEFLFFLDSLIKVVIMEAMQMKDLCDLNKNLVSQMLKLTN